MQPVDSVLQKLIDFIGSSFLDSGSQLTADTPLLDLNILDSASLFDVVDFVRAQWHVHIPPAEMHPGNFASIGRLDLLIHRLLQLETTK
jgi:acyl carrier protein